MKNEFKNMSRQELRDLLAEKNGELFELVNEINKETEFDALLFSTVGLVMDILHHRHIVRLGILQVLLIY